MSTQATQLNATLHGSKWLSRNRQLSISTAGITITGRRGQCYWEYYISQDPRMSRNKAYDNFLSLIGLMLAYCSKRQLESLLQCTSRLPYTRRQPILEGV